MWATQQDVIAFIADFESCRLPRLQWTHRAHLVAAFWYTGQHAPDAALSEIRARIRCYNEAVGTANTDTGGYHETITRLFVAAVCEHRRGHAHLPFEDALLALLASPLGESTWPLRHYSRQRLLSPTARCGWVEPDLAPCAALALYAVDPAASHSTN